MKKLMLVCLLAWFVSSAGAAAGPNSAIADREVKKYFPGDFVHVIVEAPPDTARIVSLMPNQDRIELIHDRRLGIWHGLWQVPLNFESGSYTALLEAKDLEGETFSGETAPFIIGELTIISIVKKAAAPTAETKAEESRRLEVETARLAEQAAEEVAPASLPVTIKQVAPKATRPKPAARRTKIRNVKFVEVGNLKNLNVAEARLLTTARYYTEKMEFDKVQASLKSLTRIAPANQAYRKMLDRVETVIKTEKEKNK